MSDILSCFNLLFYAGWSISYKEKNRSIDLGKAWINLSPSLAMGILLPSLCSLALFKPLVYKKENSEFNLALLRFKNQPCVTFYTWKSDCLNTYV